jgi:hypothetical protein
MDDEHLVGVATVFLVALTMAVGCGGESGNNPVIKSESQPFPPYGQKFKRCRGDQALHVGGYDLRVAGSITCEAARPLVKGFAPHPGETVQRLHGFTCYSRLVPRDAITAVCINGDRVFRFKFA